ncbi:MAG TPA: hypothetical protein VNQ80_15460 [Parapedobacter sp.]|uniref:hypothetical protein n=1 Tax=Parapedobacter sp. TaxID=1958893 RepID=UPI002D0A2F37|nr:hypothetical protein [Parapedobacter sp.]HWK58740.1 hypothetical protein [Parapedobacter sp.]
MRWRGAKMPVAWHVWEWVLIFAISGCGVFRDSTRDRRLDKVDASVLLDVARVDTSKRLVLERWNVQQRMPGQSYSFGGNFVDGWLRVVNPLFELQMGLDSLGNVLSGALVLPPSDVSGSGERLTLEQAGKSERDNSQLEVNEKHKADERTGTASWKGVWVWLGGIALVLVFLYVLVRYYLRR